MPGLGVDRVASEKLGGEGDEDGETDERVAGLRSFHGDEEGRAQQDERSEKEDDWPRARNAPPNAETAPKGQRHVDDIHDEQKDGYGLIDGIVFPGLSERENMAGVGQALDTWRKP